MSGFRFAASINPLDWKLLSGYGRGTPMELRFPAILGRDASGDVLEVGDDGTSLRAGDRVLGFASGTFATTLGEPPGASDRGLRVIAIRTRPDARRLSELSQAAAERRLVMPVQRTFPLENAADAFRGAARGRREGAASVVKRAVRRRSPVECLRIVIFEN